jgi:hypothetical protein
MRKRLLIIGLIFILIISIISILWHVYDLSSDYNYATAKIDIKNGNVKIINIGIPKISSKDKEIEMISTRYGFKNIYIEKYTPQQTEKGINNYNELIETYLTLRNGSNWKTSYKSEVDSLYKVAANQNN